MTRDDLDRMLVAYRTQCLAWAARLVPPEEVEDLVHTVYLELLQRDPPTPIQHPRLYLYHAMSRHAAKIRRQPTMESEDSLATLEAPSSLSVTDEHGIKRALGKLPPYIACLVELVYFEQVSVKDAVRRTNAAFDTRITLGQARYWLRFRGKVGALLRRALE